MEEGRAGDLRDEQALGELGNGRASPHLTSLEKDPFTYKPGGSRAPHDVDQTPTTREVPPCSPALVLGQGDQVRVLPPPISCITQVVHDEPLCYALLD